MCSELGQVYSVYASVSEFYFYLVILKQQEEEEREVLWSCFMDDNFHNFLSDREGGEGGQWALHCGLSGGSYLSCVAYLWRAHLRVEIYTLKSLHIIENSNKMMKVKTKQTNICHLLQLILD